MAAWLLGLPGLAAAEDAPDCKKPKDQLTMTQCAGLDYEAADAALNAAWPQLKGDAVDSDKVEGADKHDYENALMVSQRAWIKFRDEECYWQGFAAHGGSMEPMLVNMCLAKLTRERITQLQTGVSE